MSDPIRKILRNGGYSYGIDNKIKQIRQQIGREINKVAVRRGHFLAVREVCKLEKKS